MQQECGICADPYNKVRKAVTCPRCDASACTRCVKTYLLTNTIEPKCMGCQSAWDMDFVRKNLSKSFLDSQYKKHQVSALLSRAEASLGEMQPFVAVRARIEAATEEIRIGKARSESIYTNLTRLVRDTTALRLHQNEKRRLEGVWASGQLPMERAVFFMACPRKECRGRVSSAYKCGLCEHWACPDCHGDKGLERHGPHECRNEDRETVRMLKQNTKNCPECHEGIFKEYGCDQMWCTRCRTCFSWSSGKKLNGTIHNPHYYEYMRRHNGNAAATATATATAGVCEDGLPEYDRLVRKWTRYSEEDQAVLRNTHRLTMHLRYVEIPSLRAATENHEAQNARKWSVEYLRQHVTREEWGQKLYVAHRKKERGKRRMDVLEMYVMVSTDIYRGWYNDAMTGPEMMESIRALLKYANENIAVCNNQYGTKTALLDPNAPQDQHILEYHRAAR
jgi:hypothetical protein